MNYVDPTGNSSSAEENAKAYAAAQGAGEKDLARISAGFNSGSGSSSGSGTHDYGGLTNPGITNPHAGEPATFPPTSGGGNGSNKNGDSNTGIGGGAVGGATGGITTGTGGSITGTGGTTTGTGSSSSSSSSSSGSGGGSSDTKTFDQSWKEFVYDMQWEAHRYQETFNKFGNGNWEGGFGDIFGHTSTEFWGKVDDWAMAIAPIGSITKVTGVGEAATKVQNILKNNFSVKDIVGALRDMMGNPVLKKGGGFWDHAGDLNNTLRGLRSAVETLKGVNSPEAKQAYNLAIQTINTIEEAIKGAGL
jgi:hypothetical protein